MRIPLVDKCLPKNGNDWRITAGKKITMGERPLILNAAQALLATVLGGAVLFTAIGVSSIVWGMATGDHFQGYVVPVEWSTDGLEAPEVVDSDVAVRGIGVPVEGSVTVDFGRGWHRWLVLVVLGSVLRYAASVEEEHSLTV